MGLPNFHEGRTTAGLMQPPVARCHLTVLQDAPDALVTSVVPDRSLAGEGAALPHPNHYRWYEPVHVVVFLMSPCFTVETH